MAFNRVAVGECHAAACRMAGVGPISRFEQNGMEHADLNDFSRDTVDLNPIAEANSVSANQDKPAEKPDDEVLECNCETSGGKADEGSELCWRPHNHEQNQQNRDNLQCDSCNCAKGLHLPTIQFHLLQQ